MRFPNHLSRFGRLEFVAACWGVLWSGAPLPVHGAAPPYPDRFHLRVDIAPRFELTGGTIAAVAVDEQDRVYATGTFSSAGADVRVGVLRYRADGSVDPTYRPAPLLGGVGRLLQLLPGGRLLVAGSFTHVGGVPRAGIARLLADGSVDPAFDPGAGPGWEFTAMAVLDNGSVLVAGTPHLYDGAPPGRVARLKADGSIDPAFAPVVNFSAAVTALVPLSDGSFYANGSYINPPGIPGMPGYSTSIVRLFADGSRDPAFNPPLIGTASAMIRLANGRVLAGGKLYSPDFTTALPGLLRLLDDGSIDPGFQAEGLDFVDAKFTLDAVGPLIVQADGMLVATTHGLWTTTGERETTFRVIRLAPDGALDATFTPTVAEPVAFGIATDRRLVIATTSTPPLRLSSNGAADTEFNAATLLRPGTVEVVTPTPDGHWLVGGNFDRVDGRASRGLERFKADFSLDDTFSTDRAANPVRALAVLPDGHILVDQAGTHLVYAPLIPPGTYPTSRVMRLNAAGTIDADAGTALFGPMTAILVRSNSEIFVSYASNYPYGLTTTAVSRMDGMGSYLNGISPPIPEQNSAAFSLANGPGDTVFAVYKPGYQDLVHVRRLTPAGTIDPEFSPNFVVTGSSGVVLPLPGGKALFGWSGQVDSATDPASARHLALLNNDGTADPNFAVGTGLTRSDDARVNVRALVLQEDGRFVVAGDFDAYQSAYAPGLIRLNPDGSRDATLVVDGQATGCSGFHHLQYTPSHDLLGGGEWNYFSDTGTLGMGLVLLQSATQPRILQAPAPQTVPAGASVTLRVEADSASTLTYQWQELVAGIAPLHAATAADTWVDLAGATGNTLEIPSVQSFHAGSYRVVVSAGGVAVVTAPVTVAVNAAPASTSRLLNLSTRGLSAIAPDILIPGFVISGTQDKRLLIRAVGPTLALEPIELGGTLIADPQLTLKKYNFTTEAYEDLASNDDWGTNANAAAIATTAAELFAFELKDAKEAALLMDLAPGQYTVHAGDKANATGLAIVELYDADASGAGSRLINISNRGYAGTGDQVMIPGFVVSNEGPKTLLVRVVGPTLAGAPYNVPGTMADPKLTIYSGQTAILENDNWGDNPDAATTASVAQQLSAFALDADSADAAFVVTLQPGVYTVVGSSATAGGTGVVLVELYVVP